MAVERWKLNVERAIGLKHGNHHLTDLIRSEIKTAPVSFAKFMEQALYHPGHGYYSSGRAKLGRRGDYFTNVNVGSVFGQLLAIQFDEIWEQLGRPNDFVIVEQGAHGGDFANDLLTALAANSSDCFERLCYRIVEPFESLREKQMAATAKFGDRIDWRSSLDSVEPFVGIHFSNELLDAMPVHLVRRRRGSDTGEQEWVEKYVGWQDDGFVFVEQPIADARLLKRLESLSSLPIGFETELNLAALDWIETLSAKLQRGYVLIIDYGFSSHELFAGRHSRGTLQCRSEHRVVDSPFENIGNCDITSHVNWTTVAEHAQKQGLHIAGFADQHHFLTGIISEHPEFSAGESAKGRRQLQTLLHPEMMGRSFQALGLSREIVPGARLGGFKFAGSAGRALGLVESD